MFYENIVTLVGWICKNYSTFGLFNVYCSSLFLFFIFILFQSSICALFSTVFLHCSYSVFHCSSTIPFWLATLSFSFSLLFVLFFPFYIYIYIYIYIYHYTSSVFAPCAHYSCNSALVSWIFFFFFPLCSTLLFIQLAL